MGRRVVGEVDVAALGARASLPASCAGLRQKPGAGDDARAPRAARTSKRAATRGRPYVTQRHSKIRTELLFQVLLLAIALEPGSRGYAAAFAGTLPGRQGDEESYYAKAYTVLDLSLPELLADFPELQGMEPATDQEELPAILSKAGGSVEQLYHNLTSVVADEQVTEEQCGYDGRVKSSRHLRFGYLIIVNKAGPTETLDEYRTKAGTTPAGSAGGAEAFSDTSNFASKWLLFYPGNQFGSTFRYLGRQVSDGRSLYVVAFAEQPGRAAVSGRAVAGDTTAVMLYQGVAWIDASSFRIVKMRLDLLKPRLDVGVERSTTEIRFGEVRIPQAAAALWLPEDVTVTTIYYGQLYRNRHVYSNFRVFAVHSTIVPATPRQPHPPN